jgi:hypothetical protein
MPTPQRGVAYTFTIGLFDVATPGRFKTTPTLAAGDFKLAKDGGALANLTTLPAETPAGSGLVVVSLSATEMTADKLSVKWSDPDLEWSDGHYFWDAPVSTLDNLAAAVKNALADALLQRDWTAVTGEAARSLLNAGRFLRNKWSVVGTTLSVTKEDDATTAWQAALTTDGAAQPVIASDPA